MTPNSNEQYPKAAIPLAPVLSVASISCHTQAAHHRSVLANAHRLHTTSGRAALALALKQAQVGRDDQVLIPAFHCESMIAPVLWCKATPVFYRVKANTDIDLADITHKLTKSTKAIIATHYFGFMQNLDDLKTLCNSRKILLIEDCAHAFFGYLDGHHAGSWGDFCIASSMKFFPVYDGGILSSNNRPLTSQSLQKPPLRFQIKSLINTLEVSSHYRRLGLGGRLLTQALKLKTWLVRSPTNGAGKGSRLGPSSSNGGYGLDEHWIHRRASSTSQLIIKNSNLQRIVSLRRSHYCRINEALRGLAGCHALFSELPTGTVPLVYPLYVEQPDQHFAALKSLAVPIWRFGEFLDPAIDSSVCANSVELSRHIFQLPCHQELTHSEIDWMTDTIRQQLNQRNTGQQHA